MPDQNWDELAHRPGLAAVLDPADSAGSKNVLIDRVQKRALARTLSLVQGLRILDFGCGTGRIAHWLVAMGAVVEGVDTSAEMLHIARREAPGVRVTLVKNKTLPFEDGTFDVVLSVGVLASYAPHASRLEGLLQELSRVTAIGGRFVAIEHVRDHGLPRGASLSEYSNLLRASHFREIAAQPLRLGSSVFIRLAHHVSLLANAPLIPTLMEWEARVRCRRPLVGGTYADYLFCATRL